MNTQAPAFSVLIAAYNAEKFISRTLDSVRNQTYRHFEIVVVNDGSTDHTGAVLEEYRESNPDLQMTVITQKNGGMGAARNVGIRNARHPLIAILDHDDVWYPQKLWRVAEVFSSQEDVDIVCHDEFLVEEIGGTKRGRRRLYYDFSTSSMYEALLFKGKSLSGSATVIKKAILLDVGLFPEGKEWNGVEDFDMWLRLARKGCKIHFVNEVLGEYIVHGDNLSRDMGFTRRLLKVLDVHFEEWPKKNFYYRYLIRRRKADSIRGAGRQLMRTGDLEVARSYLTESFLMNPLSWKTLALIFVSRIPSFRTLCRL